MGDTLYFRYGMKNIKKFIKRTLINSPLFYRAALSNCVANNALPEIFISTPSYKIRELFRLPAFEHVTQLNQDIFALTMNQFQPGYFVEIGANNGFTLSNTVYLEEKFGWTGLLIEANPKYMTSLAQRKSLVINKAISDVEGALEFLDAGLFGGIASSLDNVHSTEFTGGNRIQVEAIKLETALADSSSPNMIDFISIDVEGGELPIVRQMCALEGYRFRCGCIEHNFRLSEYNLICNLLASAGYEIVWRGMTAYDLFFVDAKHEKK
jgi:FkbM family methyltransferase